uniref:Uncharacterized protein MANES_06G068100 n=1 Tax=Rhizophora mucronata TaxID=61149 RepID=A0A2P2IRI0_RHIMU
MTEFIFTIVFNKLASARACLDISSASSETLEDRHLISFFLSVSKSLNWRFSESKVSNLFFILSKVSVLLLTAGTFSFSTRI